MNKNELIPQLEAFNKTVTLKCGTDGFVGAIYDTASRDEDLAVALVIGINYGQKGTSRNAPGQSVDNVGYERHVKRLNPKNLAMHTVLWNFFPYLTKREWSDETTNAADQAKRIFEEGYDDPFAAFERIVEITQPELIVFHGIRSAVPILARIALRRVGRQGILVPNLSRPHKPGSEKMIA